MKKSQIRMGETIAALIFVFVLIIIGFVLYVKVQSSNVYSKSSENANKLAMNAVQNILYLPELQCLNTGIITTDVETLCFDKIKLEKFKDIVNNNPSYSSYYDVLFRKAYIHYKIIYPPLPQQGEEQEETIYGKDLGKDVQKISTTVPVNIYDPLEDKTDYALLTVDYYVQ